MFDYLFAISVGVFAAKVRKRNGWLWGGFCLFLIGIGQMYIMMGGGNSLMWTAFVVAGLLLLLVALKPGKTAEVTTGAVKDIEFALQQDVLLTGVAGNEESAFVQLAALLKLDADGLKDRLSAGPFVVKRGLRAEEVPRYREAIAKAGGVVAVRPSN